MKHALTIRNTLSAMTLAALAAVSVSAAAATLTATGKYNLGTDSAAGATSVAPTSCSAGQDVLDFQYGANSIGLHAYACDFGFFSFANGSRSSGENTYYVEGISTISGTITVSGGVGLSLFVAPGQVGAFGSTAFGAGEYQESTLSILLTIDNTTIFDDDWQAMIGAGGAQTFVETHAGSQQVSSSAFLSGAGYVSTVVDGGYFFIPLADGDYNINYVMSSMARGNITNATVCRGVNQNVNREEAAVNAIAIDGGDPSFASYCGAGAQTGDPFAAAGTNPLARPFQTPEPSGLALLGLSLAAIGLMRRRQRAA